jgi:hypothetical protein
LFYSKKLVEAFAYAMFLHQDDKKMGHPIMSHVLDVVSLILHFGGKEYPELAYELEIAVRELENLIY